MGADLCNRPAFGGGHCQLEAGHDGKHFRAWPDGGGYSWDDEATDRMIDRHLSGRD